MNGHHAYRVAQTVVRVGQRGIAKMVFNLISHSNPILFNISTIQTLQKSHTLIVIACNTLLLLWIDSRSTLILQFGPRLVKNSATASASRLEKPGLSGRACSPLHPANSAQRGLCLYTCIQPKCLCDRSGACYTICCICYMCYQYIESSYLVSYSSSLIQ